MVCPRLGLGSSHCWAVTSALAAAWPPTLTAATTAMAAVAAGPSSVNQSAVGTAVLMATGVRMLTSPGTDPPRPGLVQWLL
ncbi:hypothetical protein ACQP2T_60310 [Nonomuraea sp. CA-143628]|uniref:hypothetical protein n=1 Tax=Nonomuraea sp. CA-143628 TaxID=3239997 RepID=UPI003D905B86